MKLTHKRMIFSAMLSGLLSGCTVIDLPYSEVAARSDQQVCQLNNQLVTDATQQSIENVITKRNIDCNPNHWACVSYGLSKGTKEYADCRLKIRQMIAEQDQEDARKRQLNDMQAQQLQHERNMQMNQMIMQNRPFQQPQEHIMTIYNR